MEAYILFQTAVMDESTAKKKIRAKGSLYAFTISNTHMQSLVVLNLIHNRCDWNNGTPGGIVEADGTFAVCHRMSMCECDERTQPHTYMFVDLCDVLCFFSYVMCLSPYAQPV